MVGEKAAAKAGNATKTIVRAGLVVGITLGAVAAHEHGADKDVHWSALGGHLKDAGGYVLGKAGDLAQWGDKKLSSDGPINQPVGGETSAFVDLTTSTQLLGRQALSGAETQTA